MAFMAMPAFADTPIMVFKTSDGATHSIAAAGLDIKFADGQMVASNPTESLSLPLSGLSTMEFGLGPSGITEPAAEGDGHVAITGINGLEFGSFDSMQDATRNLDPGVYIVRYESGETSKLIIRQ